MKKSNLIPIPLALLAALLFGSNPAIAAAEPVLRDVAYDNDDVSQKLDVYRADADKPVPAVIYIHGGGWSGGSKSHIPGFLAKAVEEGWLSVVSVEYRFTNVATHPAQVNDCTRAVQFVRSKAKEWNIDPKHIGVTGGSAGGHLSSWVALHDDLANPKSDDRVEHESSRVQCAVDFAGPTNWDLLGKIEHTHPGYRKLIGYGPGVSVDDMSKEKMEDVSPITFVSADDPAILIVHGNADPVVPVEHAQTLFAALEKAGTKPELMIVEGGDHGVAGANATTGARASAFFKEHLTAD